MAKTVTRFFKILFKYSMHTNILKVLIFSHFPPLLGHHVSPVIYFLYLSSHFCFFTLLFVLGGVCKHWGPTAVTQPSAGQTIKGSSNSVWHVVLPFRMERGTAPGISRASITHCQDCRRLLCQNNNVDIHHERPSPPHPIFSPFHPLFSFSFNRSAK